MEHDLLTPCPLAATLAGHLRKSRGELTYRWLDRLTERVALTPDRVFPAEDLIDHMPLLIGGIADYTENPAQPVTADTPVISKALELGALRYGQGFAEHEILKEYEIFGGILFTFLASIADESDIPCTRGELLVCGHRLFHAVALIQQTTLSQFLQLVRGRLTEQEERLRAFHRALTHEFRNRMGAAMGASHMLEMPGLDESRRAQLAAVIARNVDSMRVAMENLLELSREAPRDSRQQRHVHLPQAASEAVREMRAHARARQVEIRVADLPDVEVNAAAVELCLMNLLSNAIKYADPDKPTRWVDVRGLLTTDEGGQPREVVVEVADNGIGVPLESRPRLFERFYRAEREVTALTEGTGLGLSIVRETIESLGGRVAAEFPDQGTTFRLTIPCRRRTDAQAVADTRTVIPNASASDA